jgi:ankyrin repeat protein
LNNKADPNISYEGKSPLYIASHQGRTLIVELLLNNKTDPNISYEGKLLGSALLFNNSSTIDV